MMKKHVPSTIQELIRGLIPPKGIKRKNNIEGDEISEDEDEDDDDDNENVLLEQLSGEIEIEVVTEPEGREPNSVNSAGTTVSLVGISDDNVVNKDALFLEQIVLDRMY